MMAPQPLLLDLDASSKTLIDSKNDHARGMVGAAGGWELELPVIARAKAIEELLSSPSAPCIDMRSSLATALSAVEQYESEIEDLERRLRDTSHALATKARREESLRQVLAAKEKELAALKEMEHHWKSQHPILSALLQDTTLLTTQLNEANAIVTRQRDALRSAKIALAEKDARVSQLERCWGNDDKNIITIRERKLGQELDERTSRLRRLSVSSRRSSSRLSMYDVHRDLTEHRWIPDASAPQCMHNGCGRRFGVWIWRHHCRRCYRIFCGRHTGVLPLSVVDGSLDRELGAETKRKKTPLSSFFKLIMK
ncbi:hypothetical protein M427DRAFT_389274 [Gonapodya prolifera JEL478]|uniref:FYVE zinc finger domain-containing protein n=1 Tax=Gonapodya prolifera (strain JEL478) TaxID=1344416 RepID=A0A139A819_GONPJ|nr:hypothetical protein M427DRAFT_389274 [Gonapodya prolifera JEL478]|eukprot:KXS12828.1 hypothetical protein M427DRAFT_389274 [Gonapodya prolifera JEL478]